MSLLLAAITLAIQKPVPTPSTVPALPPPTKVVISVNGHTITAKELEGYLWDWNASQVGQALITLELIRQEAAKTGVVVSESEVKDKVDLEAQMIAARGPKGIPVDEALRKVGVPRSRIELGIRAQLLMEGIAGKSFKGVDFDRVATIIVRPKTQSSDDMKTAVSNADAAYAALQKGDDWGKVLTEYATDSQVVKNQGELGWVKIDQFPDPAKAELATLKSGGFTKPVITPNGIQIFKLETRGKDGTAAEMSSLKSQYLSSAERDIVARLQKNAKITTSF
jgi:hypothetical protein